MILGDVREWYVSDLWPSSATYPQQFKTAFLRPAGTGTVAGLVVCVVQFYVAKIGFMMRYDR